MLSTLSPGPNVFSRPRTTCSYAPKSMPQHVLQLCCWTWKKIEKLYFVIQGKNANKFLVSLVSSSQETTGNAMVSDHSASSFISMLFTFSWAHYMKHADITDSQTDKASGHLSSMEFLGHWAYKPLTVSCFL